ncbi:transglycosylase domain-containing protein [Aquibacillus salsiterrae]|uniref:Penicillin-binding protein n=1 Tax=Aquibacillus salsiterrae TaxID=2950439 RepID=A0A9X3WBP0_9BACI|nr:transglycosylase domain-containing protein [Aquibacillus salsiterrae]MDC3415783.1 penicillin-binding protein [Aquibacillus salsiterrae]
MDYKKWMKKMLSSSRAFFDRGSFKKGFRMSYDVIWNIILFFIIIGVIGLFFGAGIGFGYFASLVKDEEVRPRASMEKDIYNYEETSQLYFANNVYLGEINSDLYREAVPLDKVSPYVKDAIIATEDEYFKTHNGVVPKAILRAIIQEATNASVKTGGSTLTQQLIKNQILTNEVSFERKAKEILLALRLERFFNKDEILEAYLNIVPFGRNAEGRNIAGIQTAAQGIFGVDAANLTLPQAAFIAGLPQSPSYYTPFTNRGQKKDADGLAPGLNRMKSVLGRMLENGSISKEEYDEAITYNIVNDLTEPKPSPLEQYPFLTNEVKKRATDILADILAKEDGYTEEDLKNNEVLQEEYDILASRNLTQSGYKIHTTIDKDIYEKFQEIAKTYDNYGREKPVIDQTTGEKVVIENPETGKKEIVMEPVQVGSILIENSTGKIISFVGGRDFKTEELNHATSAKRPNGSTMKPLLVYSPAMEAGVVQPGSIIADTDTEFQYPGMPKPWNPKNYTGRNYGLVSVREALYKSHNVPAAKTYMQIINDDPATNYLEKMGFTSLTSGDHSNPAMALGGLTNGVTVEENTNAYATFGNGGKFIDAYMIDKIETDDGEIVYQHKSETEDVFSPQTNYLMIDMMRDVLTRGTATVARANLENLSIDWAGKTGTSNDWHDTWFVATNPNVTLGSWMGYDTPKVLDSGYSSRNVVFWSMLVNAATTIRPELMAPEEKFERPGGIVSRSYCITSGMPPSDLCNELGLVKTDLFNVKFVPKEKDDSLIKGRYVMIDNKAYIAGPNTPEEFIKEDGIAFNPEWLKRNGYDKLDDLKDLIPSSEGVWQDIKFPSTDEVPDDKKAPDVPSKVSFQEEDQAITWNKATSKDVVGYRIYQATRPDGAYVIKGSTTKLTYVVPDEKAAYRIKAVDYAGNESDATKTVVVGDFSKSEEQDQSDKPEPNSGNEKTNDQANENGSSEDSENDPSDILDDIIGNDDNSRQN